MGLKKLSPKQIVVDNHKTKDINTNMLIKLENNLKKYGQIRTLIVQRIDDTENFRLIDGHQLFKAIRNVGIDEVYCFVVNENIDPDLLSLEINTINFDIDYVLMSKKIKRLLDKYSPEEIEHSSGYIKEEIIQFPRVETFDFKQYDLEMHNNIYLETDDEYF